ncbi:MAG: hypothetical protein ACYC0Q_01445 [Eubacteriales bacterium]
MKKLCKIRGIEVETSELPVEKKLASTGEKVRTGQQLFCHEKAQCKVKCVLINKESGINPFDQ